MWDIKQEVKNDTLDIYIYDSIRGDSYNWWTGEIEQSETSSDYFKQLLEANHNVSNINLYINSMGGSVYEGIAIYSQLKRHKAKTTAYIDGFACSIASVIAMSADKIVMPKNTIMMVHNVWTYAEGNAEQFRKIADDLDKMNTIAIESYMLKAGDKLTEDKVRELMNAETYLTAQECVEYGLADEFTEVDADLEKAKAMFNQAKEAGMSAYASRLEKICALASEPKKPEPTPEPEPKQETDKFELFKKYFFKGE